MFRPQSRPGPRGKGRGKGPYRRGASGPGRRGDHGGRFFRKKINRFYTVFTEKTQYVDHKETDKLSKFLTEKGKILPRRITGLTAKQQRWLARAIKRARQAGLVPFQVD